MSEEEIIQLKSYVIDKNKEIGRGQYGVVYQCKDLNNPNLNVCAKIIEDKLDDPKTLREIDLMKTIMTCAKGNRNIVGVEYVDATPERIVLILEKCECDLQKIIDKKKSDSQNFHPNEALNVLKQVVNGYKVLYSNNIIHRDLKPGNILVLEGVYKIADLGLARVLEANTNLTKVGTPKYVAPQLYLDTFFSNSADIYSLGIIIYEIIFGKLPYLATTQVQIRKSLRNLEKVPVEVKKDHPGMTNDFANLIESMLKFKENDRISWEQLFKHPLIQEGGSNVVMNQSGFIQDFPDGDDEEEVEPVQEQQQQKPIESPTREQQVPQKAPIQPIPTFNGVPQFQQPIKTPNVQNPGMFSQCPQGKFQTSPNIQTGNATNNFIPLQTNQQKPPMVFQPQKIQQNLPNLPLTSTNVPLAPTNVPLAPTNVPLAPTNVPLAPTIAAQNNIGQIFQFQQVQAQSDQLFQAGFAMDLTLDLLEKFINMQFQLKSEWFGLKFYLHCFSQCFYEHSKAMKTQSQTQQNMNQQFIYSLQNVDQQIEKQNKYHQIISQELELHQLNQMYPVMAVNPDFGSYLQKLKLIMQIKGLFLYSNDRKYFLEYIQLLYCLERLKDITSTSFEEIYASISDIFKSQKVETFMIDYLNKRYSI